MRIRPHVWIIAVLVAAGVAAALVWIPKDKDEVRSEGTQDRLKITSALRRAVTRAQRETGKWPKGIEEMKGSSELRGLDEDDLKRAKYDLLKSDKVGATYRLELDGKSREVHIPVKGISEGIPSRGAVTGAGG